MPNKSTAATCVFVRGIHTKADQEAATSALMRGLRGLLPSEPKVGFQLRDGKPGLHVVIGCKFDDPQQETLVRAKINEAIGHYGRGQITFDNQATNPVPTPATSDQQVRVPLG